MHWLQVWIPFLDQVVEKSIVSTIGSDKIVGPLFQHLFACKDPTLAFVGLNFKVVPFPFSELQVEWLAKVYAGEMPLVPKELRRAHGADGKAEMDEEESLMKRHALERDCDDKLV